MFKNRVPRMIFGPKRKMQQKTAENCITKSFIIVSPKKYYYSYQIKEDEMGLACGTYREEQKCLRGMVGTPQGERDNLQDPGTDGGVTMKLIFKKFDGMMMTVFTWHRTQTSGRCLWTNECQDA
jgi:hypothetical protein